MGPRPLEDDLEGGREGGRSRNFGGALMPGEGEAIAQYAEKNMRIPRRGEVGWQGEEIERLEELGYVMSGNRHKRMNAIRIRKENQVYTALEKKALALIQLEENKQKEATLLANFKQALEQRKAKGVEVAGEGGEEGGGGGKLEA